jgi:Zn-dependent M28 family amino/carboxypeptidase
VPYEAAVPTGPAGSAAGVRAIVGVLAADSMEGRLTGTPGSARAARYLAELMRGYGLVPAGDSAYFQRVTYQVVSGPEGQQLRLPGTRTADSVVGTISDVNVIGLSRGADSLLRNEAVVLGAHFDHMGVGAVVGGDSIYNGADDNASGVASVLAAARALAQRPPRRTVVILLTSGEEQGVLGTQWYLQRPAFPLSQTVADLQVEMVGRPDSMSGKGRLWLTGYERSTMGESFARAGLNVVPDARPQFKFFERSDNIVFALKGIPAHTLSSFGMHDDYHQPSDEVGRIDFEHLERAAELVTRAARILADGDLPVWHPGGRPFPASP